MSSVEISEHILPRLDGKVAVVTGGSSGIGASAVRILASKGAKVHVLDLNLPETMAQPPVHYHRCNTARWVDLVSVLAKVGEFDMLFANAGIAESSRFVDDLIESSDQLLEPSYEVLDVNLRGTLNAVKFAIHTMRRQKSGGSIVITTSATAYAPEQSLPVYAAGKLALVGLIRALRSVVIKDNITINGVAPAATRTGLLPDPLAAPISAHGLPISSPDLVGLALVFSATARQTRKVEAYGKEDEIGTYEESRWNGRVLLTLGDKFTELEEPLSALRRFWLGEENLKLTRLQQAATDNREL